MALAVGLRFVLLGRNSLWVDEAFTAYAVRKSWQDLIIFLTMHEDHPPLYFALVKVWTGIAGTGEAALRAPSAVFGAVCVPLTYAVMRRLSGTVPALMAALIVAISPFEVMAGQDARMYTLLQMFALATTWLVILPDCSWRRAAYIGAVAAMVYTHYLGFLVIVAHGIWTAWGDRRRLVPWLMDVGAAGLLFVPWMPVFFEQIMRRHGWGWAPHALLDVGGLFAFGGSLFGLGSFLFPGFPLSAAQVGAVLPFIVLAILGGRGMALPALVLVAPIGTMALLSLAFPAFFPRWFSFVFPFYAMLVVNGASRIASRPGVAAVLVALVIAWGLPVLSKYYLDPSYRTWNWRDAAAYVRADFHPGDMIVFVGDDTVSIPFDYYFGPAHGSLTLKPTEVSRRRASFFSNDVVKMARQHPRLWVISQIVWRRSTRQRLIPVLRTAYREAGVRTFSGVDVYLFEVERGSGCHVDATALTVSPRARYTAVW